MLYFIFAWTLLIIACCSIGTAALNLLRAHCFERVGDRFIVAIWLGIVVLAVSLLATSLVLPLSPSVGGIIILSLTLGTFILQKTWNELFALISSLSRQLIFCYLILACGVAALTTQQVTWIDTGLYHFSLIQWLSKFGAVPGLALLYSNLGFTSSWFAFAAPWNPDIFGSRVTAIANGFVFLISASHFLICLFHIFTNKFKKSDWFVVFYSMVILPLIATHNLMALILISPSPDLPIVFITLVLSWTILIISEDKSAPIEEKPFILDAKIIPLILSAGAVTIKLTALPLLLISGLFYVFGKRFSLRRVLSGIAVSFLLISPLFMVGIVTSGCPLFPSNIFCLNLPWSLTVTAAKKAAKITHSSKSWYGSRESGTNYILELFWNWLNSANINQVIALLIVVSILCCIPIAISSFKRKERGQLWLIALVSSGITFLMVTAPFFRFALAYIITIPNLLLANYCHEKYSQTGLEFINRLTAKYQSRNGKKAILAVCLFCVTLISIVLFNKSIQAQLILPPPLPKGEAVQKQVNDITYFSPKSSTLCWATELPCAFKVEDYVQLRDPAQGIKAGFVRKTD